MKSGPPSVDAFELLVAAGLVGGGWWTVAFFANGRTGGGGGDGGQCPTTFFLFSAYNFNCGWLLTVKSEISFIFAGDFTIITALKLCIWVYNRFPFVVVITATTSSSSQRQSQDATTPRQIDMSLSDSNIANFAAPMFIVRRP